MDLCWRSPRLMPKTRLYTCCLFSCFSCLKCFFNLLAYYSFRLIFISLNFTCKSQLRLWQLWCLSIFNKRSLLYSILFYSILLYTLTVACAVYDCASMFDVNHFYMKASLNKRVLSRFNPRIKCIKVQTPNTTKCNVNPPHKLFLVNYFQSILR